MSSWDSARVKSHLRLTAQKLAQLQDRQEDYALLVQSDIATLLTQGNVHLARLKAEKLYLEDVKTDILGKLESYCDVILGSFGELRETPPPSNSNIFEPVCSILYAAPKTGVKELVNLKDILVHRFGSEFLHWVLSRSEDCVPPPLYKSLQLSHVPVDTINTFLTEIARSHSIAWLPPLTLPERITAIAEILDPSSPQEVNLVNLQDLCSGGIPHEPPWLRPRVWRIFLGLISLQKANWSQELRDRRETYYDLARRLLSELFCQPPSYPLSRQDASVIGLSKALSGVPIHLTEGLDKEPAASSSCPFGDSAPLSIRIVNSNAVEDRLDLLQGASSRNNDSQHSTPDITLQSDSPNPVDQPHIMVTAPSNNTIFEHANSTILYSSQPLHNTRISTGHKSALLRLLYLHSSMYPSTSPHLAAIALALYNCLCREVEPDDLSHVEADTFWMLGELVGETGDLAESQGSQIWMRKFGNRIQQTDDELYADLVAKGLDPALPHFSYKWLTPLLTYTLSIDPLFTIWDGILAQQGRTPEINFKLDFLVDVCTAMLTQVRSRLFRFGKRKMSTPGLWEHENAAIQHTSAATSDELEYAFIEGMSFLQNYSVEEAGGAEKLLEVASSLPIRPQTTAPPKQSFNSFTGNFWRGLTKRADSPSESEEDVSHEYSDIETVTTPRLSLSARLKESLVRGISNASAMDIPPSPSPPPSPGVEIIREVSSSQDSRGEPSGISTTKQIARHSKDSSIWNYTASLRNSDAAATISKLGTNWRAKALSTWGNQVHQSNHRPSLPAMSKTNAPPQSPPAVSELLHQNIVVPETYVFPERPAVFRSPRDSFTPHSRRAILESPSPDSPVSTEEAAWSDSQRSASVKDALRALSGIPPSAPQKKRIGPKPLMLNPSNLITPSNAPLTTRSASSSPSPHQGQWSDVYRDISRTTHHSKGSQSSASIVSTSRQSISWSRVGETEEGSRVVPLRRTSVVPRPAWNQSRVTARTRTLPNHSLHDSSGSEYLSDSAFGKEVGQRNGHLSRGWQQVTLPDSPVTVTSSPPLPTPRTSLIQRVRAVTVEDDGAYGGMNFVHYPEMADNKEPITSRRASHRVSGGHTSSVTAVYPETPDATKDGFTALSLDAPRTPRVRSKRHNSKPAKLQLDQPTKGTLAVPEGDLELDSITPKAGEFIQQQEQSPSFESQSSPLSPQLTISSHSLHTSEDGDYEDSYEDILDGY